MLYPSAWDSEKIAKLSDRQFRLWCWMFSTADDKGRGQWWGTRAASAPRLLSPCTPDEAEADGQAICSLGLASIYEDGGVRYYAMHDWDDFQRIDARRRHESTYPDARGMRADDTHLTRECDATATLNVNVNDNGNGNVNAAPPAQGVELAQFLQAELQKHHPRSTPSAGYLDADNLRLIAARVPDAELLDLIRWAAADSHWGPVLLARGGPGVKLRQHFDTLYAKWQALARREAEPSGEEQEKRAAKEAFKRRWREGGEVKPAPEEERDFTKAGDAIAAVLGKLGVKE